MRRVVVVDARKHAMDYHDAFALRSAIAAGVVLLQMPTKLPNNIRVDWLALKSCQNSL